MEAKECGGGEGIGWMKTGDGAALEEEEWGGRLQRRGDGLPGARLGRLCWMRAFSSVGFRPLDQYMFRTAPIDFSGTIRGTLEPVIQFAGTESRCGQRSLRVRALEFLPC
jgi:hypothetical protein